MKKLITIDNIDDIIRGTGRLVAMIFPFPVRIEFFWGQREYKILTEFLSMNKPFPYYSEGEKEGFELLGAYHFKAKENGCNFAVKLESIKQDENSNS